MDKQPNLVFIMETTLVTHKVDHVKRRLQMDECFMVDPRVRSEGLVVLWRRDIEVEIVNYSTKHVHMKVKHIE